MKWLQNASREIVYVKCLQIKIDIQVVLNYILLILLLVKF